MTCLKTWSFYYRLKNDYIFGSFLYSIKHHLEKDNWGSRFPHLMNELASGEIPYENVEALRLELSTIKKEMSKLKAMDIIYDQNNLDYKEGWQTEKKFESMEMVDYYINPINSAETYFDIFDKAINRALEFKEKIELIDEKQSDANCEYLYQ